MQANYLSHNVREGLKFDNPIKPHFERFQTGLA